MSKVGDNILPLVREWYKTQSELKELQAHEKDLRAKVIEAVFGEVKKGTSKADLSNETELVLSCSAKISIDKEKFLQHKNVMERKGLIGDESVIKLKPEVSATAYKYMSQEDKVAFDEVFVHGLNSPQLEVRTKKG